MDIRLKCPFTCLIAGATMTGKTNFVCELIESDMMDTKIEDIVVCYNEWQPAYERMKTRCRFNHGLIDPDDVDPSFPHLIILDDLMDSDDERIQTFFTRTCHHRNASVIFITQNLFSQGKGHRTCSLNAQYLILFKSPRDMSQIKVLQNQIFPGSKNFLLESYADACLKPFSYLFLDMKPQCPDHMRVRGRVLDSESQDLYVKKGFKLQDITF